jgi:hypothetical protein
MDAHDRFGRLVLAEWTKLRTVPRWMMALAAVVGLTVLGALIEDQGDDSVEAGEPLEEPDFSDEFHFVHRPLAEDGSIVARVVSQEDSHEWAKAGLMVKARLEVGAPRTPRCWSRPTMACGCSGTSTRTSPGARAVPRRGGCG